MIGIGKTVPQREIFTFQEEKNSLAVNQFGFTLLWLPSVKMLRSIRTPRISRTCAIISILSG